MSHSLFCAFVVCWITSVSCFIDLYWFCTQAPPSPDADSLIKKTFYLFKIRTEEAQYKIIRIKAHPHTAFSHFASSSSCHLIMLLSSWCSQSAAVNWNKTWEETAYRHFPATCCSSFCCFSFQWSQMLKKMMSIFQGTFGPSCVKSLSSSCLYLYCSALLEQLSRLQALLPNSSSKTKHRGTCILVRHITQHYINLHHWGFDQTA